MTTQEFIQQYREEDVRKLALQGARFPQVDLPYALDQIAGWQTARKKIPSWTVIEGMVYPPRLSMEQCSSEQTARYKVALVQRLLKGNKGGRMVDLTGGFGVDFSFLSPLFDEAVYVEQQEHLCKIAQENIVRLGLGQSEVVHADGVAYLQRMEKADLIYLDPARRDAHGARTYDIHDCTPNLLEIQDALLQKARWVVVKLSPMLDWHKAVNDLPSVTEIHVVSVGNECKELLLVLEGTVGEHPEERPLTIFCVNDEQVFTCTMDEMYEGVSIAERIEKEMFLYEPNASIMKVGCFGACATQYDVKAIGRNSHLFVSDSLIEPFPGRVFRITAVSSMNKRELKTVLQDIKKANVAVRNFPLKAEELRKRLKLADGGDIYLFGTTTEEDRHLVLVTKMVV
jgi:16S rRNA G966 N2-methylase RsmD